MPRFFTAALLSLLLTPPSSLLQHGPTESPERLRAAAEAFSEARAACEADGGQLWGKPLWGPFMLVDPATRRFVASEGIDQADPATGVTPTSTVEVDGHVLHVGSLPANFSVANTAFDYSGRRWSMAAWPIPESAESRRQLLVHELWHRIQDELGLPLRTPACEHLDEEAGRLWLRMEMRALAAALRAGDEAERRQSIADALSFRAYRRGLYEGAGENERQLELAEGLAEYTGLRLSGREDFAAWSAADLGRAEQSRSFVRGFQYALGPAYGVLLDQTDPAWREKLDKDQDLGLLLAQAAGVAAPLSPNALKEVETRAARHGYAAVREAERQRAAERDARRRDLVTRLVDGPVLQVPLDGARISFDPGNVIPLPPHGTVYPGATLTQEAAWALDAPEAEIYIDTAWKTAFVAAAEPPEVSADGRTVTGAGWTLRLEPGWRIEKAEGGNRWRLRKA
jgi:hypothetical protein